jgi:hypothetical protein
LLLNQKAIGMLNEKKFRAIYDDYLESGLTVRDYCLNQNMGEAKFFYWQNKLKGQLPPKNGFVPVVFNGDQQFNSQQLPATLKNRQDHQIKQTSLASGFSCEICYPNGIIVKFNGLPDLDMIHSLLGSTHR